MRIYLLIVAMLLFTTPAFCQSNFSSRIKQDEAKQNLNIYPNPCKNNKLTIKFKSKEIAAIRLISITGKEVLFKEYDFPNSKAQVEVSDILNGVYIIQIKTTDKKLVARKLIVSKN